VAPAPTPIHLITTDTDTPGINVRRLIAMQRLSITWMLAIE